MKKITFNEIQKSKYFCQPIITLYSFNALGRYDFFSSLEEATSFAKENKLTITRILTIDFLGHVIGHDNVFRVKCNDNKHYTYYSWNGDVYGYIGFNLRVPEDNYFIWYPKTDFSLDLYLSFLPFNIPLSQNLIKELNSPTLSLKSHKKTKL